MLNSWFASKDRDKANDTPSFELMNTNTTDGPDESLRISHRTPTGFASPHDAILARMRGQPQVEPADDGLLRQENPVLKKEEKNAVLDEMRSTPQDPIAEKELVYDPFEGTPIGLLINTPFDPTQQTETISTAGPSRVGDGKLEQWEHLARVLDLQSELARIHFEMEGVGIGDGKGKATGKGRGRGKSKGDTNWERNRGDRAKEWKPQRQTTTDTIETNVHEDEEGVDAAGNEEIEMERTREERFSNMADQFEGKKEAVQAIMNKLDHLSKALTQFHTLQAPDFEFSKTGSRQNSTTPNVTCSPIWLKTTPYTSDTFPNAKLSNIPDISHLRPVLSSIPSSRGSLSSAPQTMLEPEAGTIVPASLSHSQGDTVKEPIYMNEMEPGRQMHVMDSPDSMKESVLLPIIRVMSSQSPLGLPPIPPALKPIVPFLQRANELQTQDPVMAYWCAYHAAQLGISLKAKDTASRDVLFALLGFLERLKKEIGLSDALDIESVSSAYVENFACKVFATADNEDRSGSATRATAKKFLAAAHFLEVLKIFPKADISELAEEKMKYAKWKAADIAKAFREGRKPTPGPAGSNLTGHPEAILPTLPLPHVKDAPIDVDEHQPSTVIEPSPPATLAEVPPASLVPLLHTPPRLAGHHLDVRSFEHGVETLGGGNEEATPGSWSMAATPGTVQGPLEHWEETASPTRGAHTQRSGMPKRKPWISEELEGKDESEYLGLSVDTTEGPIIASDDSAEKSGELVGSTAAELPESRTSYSALSSSPYGEQAGPQVAEQQPKWAMDEPASDCQSQASHSPTQQPIVVNSISPGFVPNLHPVWPAGAVDSSHLELVPPPTTPGIEGYPESLPPHHNLYAPLPLSQQHWPPPHSIAVELTPSIIAKAQKHCRFAISSLDYEDAEQARKELRAALAILGDP
ncbi:hypothetical protein C0995_012971 [Termitomyces sp. Mi166|nr:hypothetical protein C0995_012971 [Termitomyces sp. Mi166\